MPPTVNRAMSPQAKSSGVLKRSDPPHIVASQLKIFTPVGMAMSMLVPAMITLNSVGRPVANMWCAHTRKPSKAMTPSMTIMEASAEERLAREDRHDLAHHAEGGQDEDVHLGVPEEPEEMLPDDRVAAAGRVEEARAVLTVEVQQRDGRREAGEGEEDEERVDEGRHREDGHLPEAHALRPEAQARDDEVDGPEDRRAAEQHEGDGPERDAVVRRVGLRGERRVAEPPGVQAPPKAKLL